jgi:FkbM family methyltransferase
MRLPTSVRKYGRSFVSKLNNSWYQNWKRKRMIRFYSEFVQKGSLCFDVGANIGRYSEVFLQLGGNVVAIEPIAENYHALVDMFANHGGIICLQVAISSQTGTAEIFKGHPTDLSTLDQEFKFIHEKQSGRSWIEKQAVQTRTLDSLIAQFGRPDFCKIDVEGHEKQVLLGLTERIPMISYEFLYPFRENAMECIELLSSISNDAVFNFSLFEFFELENREWERPASFIESMKRWPPSHWTGDIFCRM